jgi:hypothetical protein
MEHTTIRKEMVTVTNGFCIGPDMQVRIGSFINYTPPSGHHIELRVLIGTQAEFDDRRSQKLLYIQHFESLPLTAIVGNVVVPAQELLAWRRGCETPLDYRSIALQAILASELQEISFKLDRRKNTCELWFRCLKIRPQAVIPKDRLGRDLFFCPAG